MSDSTGVKRTTEKRIDVSPLPLIERKKLELSTHCLS